MSVLLYTVADAHFALIAVLMLSRPLRRSGQFLGYIGGVTKGRYHNKLYRFAAGIDRLLRRQKWILL